MTPEFDEEAALKDLQSQLRRLLKPLAPVQKLKPGQAGAIAHLEAALQALPPAETFGQALAEIAGQGQALLAAARRQRAEAFGRLEAAFVREAEAGGRPVREMENAWRVGPVEVQVNREQSRARALFNKEALLGWAPVRTLDDLRALESKANALLERCTLPEVVLPDLFWAAYQQAREGRRRQGVATFERVPMREFYRELRLTLVRRELAGKPERRLSTADWPRWAFLYNLDRYRALAASIAGDVRLGLETGSQRESSQGAGVVVGGLDPQRDYQVVCYVVPWQGSL